MSPGIISGSGGLTVTSGSLQLDNTATTQAGNSSFTGNVNITGGTLAINNIAAFNSGNGTTSPLGNMTLASRTITIGAGGVLNLLDGNTTGANTATIQASMILNGGEVIETNPYNANNSTLGPLFLNGGTLATLGGNNSNWQPFMFGENPLGSGGTVSVSGSANSYIMLSSGGTAVVNGIVADGFQLAPSNTFSVAGPGTLYVSLPLLNQNNGNSPYGGNAASLIKTGTGLLVLSASNSYTGATTISAGTLELGIGGSLASPVAVNVASGGLVFASGLGTATLGGLSGSGNIALTDLTGGNVLLNLNGDSTTNTTYSGVLSGGGGLTNGGGTLLLTNSNNAYTGLTTVTGGALVLGNTAVLPSLWQNPGGNISVTGGAFGVQAGANAGEFSLGNVTSILSNVSFPAGSSLAVQVVSPETFTLSNSISGAQGLLKLGSGTLAMSASNSFTGGTTLSAGGLKLSNSNALMNSTLTDNVAGGLIFGTSGVYNIGSLAGAGSFSMLAAGGGGVTLSLGANNATSTYSGVLTGTGGITKVGTGVEVLSGSSVYTSTTVSGGTLTLVGVAYSGTASTTTKSYTINSGGLLSLNLSGLDGSDNGGNSEPYSSTFSGAAR